MWLRRSGAPPGPPPHKGMTRGDHEGAEEKMLETKTRRKWAKVITTLYGFRSVLIQYTYILLLRIYYNTGPAAAGQEGRAQ